ncbi:hypothetical protein KO561_09125 [Radiobacillus kanasensis]|uniref:hypothetical protein n=1 Tax=Radiobacillus kanasensis TaxID=2844358 RepID=UPI001E47DA2B|nr:hypothetical protein [Radiobacillus kanasensis]UFU01076.1 hypothetical protein KO561_09125 [Radiobacillus kanasensis]
MFGIITLILYILAVFALLRNERRSLKWIGVGYYILLSIVFLIGDLYITDKYHLHEGPVPEQGFATHIDWVSIFGYFFIIPMIFLIAYTGWKWLKSIRSIGLRIFLRVLLITLLLGMGYISLFIFVLIFYGFAP